MHTYVYYSLYLRATQLTRFACALVNPVAKTPLVELVRARQDPVRSGVEANATFTVFSSRDTPPWKRDTPLAPENTHTYVGEARRYQCRTWVVHSCHHQQVQKQNKEYGGINDQKRKGKHDQRHLDHTH